MLINTTNKPYPAFISENYLNRFAIDAASDALDASSGSEFVKRVADMEPKSVWNSIGSTDAVQETISSGFWIEGSKLNVSVDFIAILNHNLKSFSLELRQGSVVQSTEVIAAETNDYTVISLVTPSVADNFRLIMNTTQVVDEEKQVGVLAFGSTRFQASLPFARGGFTPRVRQNTKTAQMADGSIRYANIYRADAGFLFDGWNVGFGTIPEAEAEDNFKTQLLCDPDPFMFWPFPAKRPSLLRQARITPNSYTDPFESDTNIDAGRSITFGIDDVGAG